MFNVEIGIDLGTANTLFYTKEKGIIFNEPSVVAIDTESGNVLAAGIEAKEMIGKTPYKVTAVRPLKQGVIANYDATKDMLRHMLKKMNIRKPKVVVSTPCGSTSVEKRAVKDALLSAGAKEVAMIDEPVAALIGAGLPVDEPRANVVVDIGGGTTEVGIVSYGGIVASESIPRGGDNLDEEIMQYVRKTYHLLIGERMAEAIKMTIGSADPNHQHEAMEVRGRDLVTGLPKSISLHAHEIHGAISESLAHILESIRSTLEQCPPELSGDIVDEGIILTGGGSQLHGIEKWLSEQISVPVQCASEPLEVVATGTGEALTFRPILQKV